MARTYPSMRRLRPTIRSSVSSEVSSWHARPVDASHHPHPPVGRMGGSPPSLDFLRLIVEASGRLRRHTCACPPRAVGRPRGHSKSPYCARGHLWLIPHSLHYASWSPSARTP